MPGVETRFVVEQQQKEDRNKSSKRLEKAAGASESVFCRKLNAEDPSGDCELFISIKTDCTHLTELTFLDENFYSFAKSLSPAAIDLELRSLVTLDSLRLFMTALVQRLRSHRDFEAVQTFQNVFLRIHGDVLIQNTELKQDLEILQKVQKVESERVLELLASSIGTLGFVRNTL